MPVAIRNDRGMGWEQVTLAPRRDQPVSLMGESGP
jgi:hypothetical protein